ncbi:hypothetical protein CSV65_14605 [Sporosarcina sp. P31]|nr:hypothetical protein CSV66_14340 [Sporosarcina sp. P30]PID07724.1 hypothetical protein CSV65_14605 [Sporosarcina sp. P31]PID10922.1 hypothetical protein CSV64_14575 [Sporosarcina sp. P32b]
MPFEFPLILGWDATGIISEVGSQVTQFKKGDAVFARPAMENGTYSEYVVVDEELVAFKPDHLSFEKAASVPLAGLTAWQCLVDFGQVKKGDKVLIHTFSLTEKGLREAHDLSATHHAKGKIVITIQ